MLRIAMLSKWHVHAAGYARQLLSRPEVKITVVWDEDAERGAAWAAELDCAFEPDLNKCVSRGDVDAVVCDAPTNMHPEVIIAAAKAKKHIFTEKCLALTIAECDQIAEAVKTAGIKFCISFPQRTFPQHLYLKKVLDEGLLGDITLFRVRNAHDGASRKWLPEYWYNPVTTGGGAMMDLGAHPMYLSRWLLGKPIRIQSMFTSNMDREIEDNSVCTLEFENKVIAIVETSLVSAMCPTSLELYGTEGSALVRGSDISIRSRKLTGPVEGWIKPDTLPKPLPTPINMFIDGIINNEPIPFDIEAATQLTQLMENAYISYREKREVVF